MPATCQSVISFHLHQNPQTRDLNLISRMRQLRFTAGRPANSWGQPANRWQSQDQNPGPPGSKGSAVTTEHSLRGGQGVLSLVLNGFPGKGGWRWVEVEPWVWGEKGSGSGSLLTLSLVAAQAWLVRVRFPVSPHSSWPASRGVGRQENSYRSFNFSDPKQSRSRWSHKKAGSVRG